MKKSVAYKTNRDPIGKWEVIAVYKTKTEKGYEMFTGEILGRFDTRKQAREFIKARKAEDKVMPEEITEEKGEYPWDFEKRIGKKDTYRMNSCLANIKETDNPEVLMKIKQGAYNRIIELGLNPDKITNEKREPLDDYWRGYKNGLKDRIAKVNDERLLNALELAVSNRFKELGIVPRSLAGKLVVPIGINDDMEMVKAVDTLKDMLRNRGIIEMKDNCASEACKQVCKQMKAMEERTNTFAHDDLGTAERPAEISSPSMMHEDRIIKMAVTQSMEYSKQHTLRVEAQISKLRNRIEVIANGQIRDVHAALIPIIDDLKRSLDSYSDARIRAAVSADIGKVYNEINKVKKDTSAALKNSDLIADSLRRAPNVNSNSDIHFPHLRGLFKRIDMLEKKSVTEISLSDNLTTFKRRTRHSIEDLEKRITELHEAINELRAQHKPSFDIKPLEEGLANLQSQLNMQIERSLETEMKYDKLDKAIRAVDDHYEHTCRLNSKEIIYLKELVDGIGRWMTAILKTRFGRKLKIDDNN